VLRIADHHPDDPALLLVPLMRRLVLEPGQAVFVGPGVLHAYLDGVALEVMTPCDNVVRGGFTAKHVAPEVLAEVVDGAAAPTVQRPDDGAHRYEVPVDDFAVWRVAGDLEVEVGERTGPDVVVAVEGTTTVGDGLELAPGEAAWIPVDDGPYHLAVDGVAHRVSTGG
jgi:mannose-6-phosphate isomerase